MRRIRNVAAIAFFTVGGLNALLGPELELLRRTLAVLGIGAFVLAVVYRLEALHRTPSLPGDDLVAEASVEG